MTEQVLHAGADKEAELQPILQPVVEVHATSGSAGGGGGSRAERLSNALHNWSQSAVVRVTARNLGLIALW